MPLPQLPKTYPLRPSPHCRECSGFRNAGRTVCVSGRDNDKEPIEILFVGEAPGEEEAGMGYAFVGRAGQLLERFLHQYLPNRAWRLSNAVRCWPNRNPNGKQKKPSAEMMKACRTYLQKEILSLQPKVVVCLGQYAAAQVLGRPTSKIKVGELMGKPISFREGTAWVLHHPSYILRSGVNAAGEGPLIPSYENEWRLLCEWLGGGVQPELPTTWMFLTRPHEIGDAYRTYILPAAAEGKPIAYDYETTGLDPWGDEFRMVGVAYDEDKAIVHRLDEEGLKWHRRMLSQVRTCTIHHFPMEIGWGLIKVGQIPRHFVDTKIWSFLLDENRPHDLDSLVNEFLPELAHYKQLYPDPATLPEEQLAARCAYDCMATYRLRQILGKRLTEAQRGFYGDVLMEACKSLMRCKARGWKLCPKTLKAQKRDAFARKLSAEQRIRHTVAYQQLANLIESESRGEKSFNFNSDEHWSRFLNLIGIDDEERMPSKPEFMRTNEKVLEKYDDREEVRSILQYRKYQKRLGTFLDPIQESSTRSGFTHPNYNWGGRGSVGDGAKGTKTGRPSCSRPNLLTPYPKLRKVWISRWGSGRILQADYAQQELRLAAIFSNEASWLHAYQGGRDLHTETAARMYGVGLEDVTEEQRSSAKAINFGILYGMGKYRLASEQKIPVKEAARLLDEYKRSNPAIIQFTEEKRREAVATCVVQGPFGMNLHLPDAQNPDPKIRHHALNAAGNFWMQHVGSIMTLWALKECDNRLAENGFLSLVMGTMYDSIYFDVHPDDDADQLQEFIHGIMVDEVGAKWPWLTLPMKVDFKLGKTMYGD